MSSCSGLLKAGKRRHPHTSMYEMVVNLYKSFVFSRTEGRDNKAHWLCADSANCWQEKKKKKSQASRYSRRVTRIDDVHTFLQRADVSEKHRRLPEPNRSILSLECMFFFFLPCWSAYVIYKKKSVWSYLIAVVHYSQTIINYFSIQLFFPLFIVLRWEKKNNAYSPRRAAGKQSLGAQPVNLLFLMKCFMSEA